MHHVIKIQSRYLVDLKLPLPVCSASIDARHGEKQTFEEGDPLRKYGLSPRLGQGFACLPCVFFMLKKFHD
eukprot:2918291-Rhodomonas_salina.8